MAAENMASPTPDGTARTMIELLQEINKNLIENLKQQNERIAEIEAKLANTSASDVQKESTPALIIPEVADNEVVPEAAKGDHENQASQRIEGDTLMVQDPVTSSSSNPVEATSSSEYCYNWLEPHELSDGVLATHPQVKTWCRDHLWIPDDGRINLAFEIQSIDSSGDLKMAKKICTDLQEVCEELVKNRGRLLIVDNDCHGSNRLFGNLTFIDEKDCLWSTELSTQYRSDTDSEMSRLPIPMDVAMIDIRQPQLHRQWRRLIVLEGLADMISKDLHDPFRDISGKFFYKGRDRRPLANHLLNEFMEDITGDFLRHGQSYLGGDLIGSDLIIIKYSWFTILPHGRVREKSRLKVPRNKWRQSFPGLKAGLLYEDKHSRWLGMDNYQIYCMSSGMSTMKSTTAPYHTMVVMRSPFPLGTSDRWTPLPRFDTQICIFEQSVIALEIIGFSTADVVDFIDKILDIGGDILLDPRKHDQLLFDDDSFSRSRKYWWVSNLLVPLQQNVENNCKVHQQLFDNLIVPIIGIPTSLASRDTSTWPNGLAEVEKRATVAYKSLEKLLERIDFQQKRVAVLRDGLFNASGVMESRASRRLSEIVKLLTYVSIFYLPLTFSTSLWSTTDTFHNLDTAMLFVVMIVIGGVTYTLVLNLEHVAQATYAYYQRLRKQVIKPMKEDTAEAWKDRAKKYEIFQFLPTDAKLSEWWVLWYIILWAVRALIRKISLVRTQAQNPLKWLRYKPKHLDNASPPVTDAPNTEDDDWLKAFPKDLNEVEIPILLSPNFIHEKISTPAEKAATLIESPPAPAKGGEATSSHISEHNKRNSGWLSFRSIFTRSTQNGGGIEGERV